MTELTSRPWFPETEWLTIPDVAERLGTSASRVRRLLEEGALLGTRLDGVLKIPAVFLRGSEPLHELRGTLTVLSDDGFTDVETIDWLLSDEESLGTSPVAALLQGRKAEVRRVAQALL